MFSACLMATLVISPSSEEWDTFMSMTSQQLTFLFTSTPKQRVDTSSVESRWRTMRWLKFRPNVSHSMWPQRSSRVLKHTKNRDGLSTFILDAVNRYVRNHPQEVLIQSNSPFPPELARHDASKLKPGSGPDRPPRRNDTVYAH
ncbi:hypothetical protein R1flu_017806 [Riccia fluitans]|uniref:Uncharacterized protein n=1 Tax=Riccia fluitans TaxID=41844 RepID=A0ABD1ZE35_9MARC